MPRDRQDCEDLLAEASALFERAELSVPNHREAVVVGFRRDGGGESRVLRQGPVGVDVLARIHQCFDLVNPPIAIAHSPRAG